jgi:glutathione S-transferase
MTEPFKIYGAELSPYSVKVRAFMRYKGVPHTFIERSAAREAEFAALAKLPLIPLVQGPDGEVQQDSTPILEGLEASHPEPATLPADPALAFAALLLEEYADEWLNKAMFHYRWTGEADRASAAGRILTMMLDGADIPDRARAEGQITERMVSRLHYVGSNPDTAPIIEAGFRRAMAVIEAHLAKHLFLFGGRPTMADFSLYGQFAQLLSDPTPGAQLRAEAPFTTAWTGLMADPKAGGPFETGAELADTLMPLLRQEITEVFLPWAIANARGVVDRAERFDVVLDGQAFPQAPQRYAAKSFALLLDRFAEYRDLPGVSDLLTAIGALDLLNGALDEFRPAAPPEHGAHQDGHAGADTEAEPAADADTNADPTSESPGA